jgi:hypothetical protein
MISFTLSGKKQKITSIVIDILFISLIYVIFFIFKVPIAYRIIFTLLSLSIMVINTWIIFGSKLIINSDSNEIIIRLLSSKTIQIKDIGFYKIHLLDDQQHQYYTFVLFDKNQEFLYTIKTFLSTESDIYEIDNSLSKIITKQTDSVE